MKDLGSMTEKLQEILGKVRRFLPLLFCLLLLVLYGFLAYRVNVLNSAEPSPTDTATQAQTAAVPRIDPNVIEQLKNLQDNSVTVKTLFATGRDNPFAQ